MEPQCQVRLEVFEGPLDLLLHLIQKNALEITDIPIALVTSQYLDYLEFMKALDVVAAGDYLVMAATLMHIKSRMLLPRQEAVEPEEDPRLEIVRPLQELLRMRRGASALASRPVLGRDVFVREEGSAVPDGSETPSDEGRTFDVSLPELITAFRKVLGNRSLPRILEITRAKLSLVARMETLACELARRGRIRFFELFGSEDPALLVVTFLAILELARLGGARLVQESPGEDILVLLRGDTLPETHP